MAVKPHKRYAGYAYMIETNMDHVWNQVAGATVSVSINKVWAPGTVNIQCWEMEISCRLPNNNKPSPRLTFTDWWYTYPSEKYESQWEGWHPIYYWK